MLSQDATPFSFHESGDKIAVDYFGEQLQAAGYNYYGSEPLYSGVSGCLMHADLYIGVVFYQRLRHMVSDKYQVRATGTVNPLTRQPIKGRKKVCVWIIVLPCSRRQNDLNTNFPFL